MKGNKGEWSEFYTFVKLLSDKKLYAADEGLEIIQELFFPLISIIRDEPKEQYEYRISPDSDKVTIFSGENSISVVDTDDLSTKAKGIFDAIKFGSNSFAIPFADEIMNDFKVTTIKAGNNKKEDITLKIHDLNTGTIQKAGFSIKSMLGSPATLLNASTATNFKYKISDCTDDLVLSTRNIDSKSKIRDRIAHLTDNGCTFEFSSVSSDVFSNNLSITDTILPLILSELLLAYFSGKGSSISDLSELALKDSKTLKKYKLSDASLRHKMKSFLHSIALGMVPASLWNGEMRAHGGYIIVREDGELVCYHVYNADQFREYLYQNVKFDSPSSTRHGYGIVYKEGNEFFFNLNIQIRFIK